MVQHNAYGFTDMKCKTRQTATWRRLAILAGMLMLGGCGWMAPDPPPSGESSNESRAQAEGDLFRLYVALSAAVDNGNIVQRRADFFTERYLQAVDPGDEKSLYLLKLTQYVDRIDSYHQQRDDRSGCLTLNGYEASNEPVVLAVRYAKPVDRWLVDDVHLGFAGSTLDFVDQPVCPDESESR